MQQSDSGPFLVTKLDNAQNRLGHRILRTKNSTGPASRHRDGNVRQQNQAKGKNTERDMETKLITDHEISGKHTTNYAKNDGYCI